MTKIYALKYNNNPNTYNCPANYGKWVAIDETRGGYPYPVKELHEAKLWTNLEEIKSYLHNFDTFGVYEVTFEIKRIDSDFFLEE